jgi:hypothetical protein
MCPFPIKYGPRVENTSTLYSTKKRHILADITVKRNREGKEDNILNTLPYLEFSVLLLVLLTSPPVYGVLPSFTSYALLQSRAFRAIFEGLSFDFKKEVGIVVNGKRTVKIAFRRPLDRVEAERKKQTAAVICRAGRLSRKIPAQRVSIICCLILL